MQHYTFTAQIERDNEAGVYVAYVPALPAHIRRRKALTNCKLILKK